MKNKLINNLEKIINSDVGIIKKIIEVPSENGLPPIYRMIAVRNTLITKKSEIISRGANGYGYNFYRNKAIVSAIGEAIERYCASFKNKNFINDSYENMKKKNKYIVDINLFSQIQLEINECKCIDSSKKINWVKGTNLIKNSDVYIPESIIFCHNNKKEDVIREESTTGLACGDTLDMAIYNGLYECIERDAFSLCWINKSIHPQIDIDSINDEDIKKIIKKIEEYNLKLYIRNITTDIGIPVYCAIIKNNNCNDTRPVRYIATKAGINVKNTLMNLIAEALGGYISLASLFLSDVKIPKSIKEIKSLEDHCLYYGKYEMNCIMHFLENDDLKYTFKEEYTDIQDKNKYMIDKLVKSNIDIYYTDITTRDVKELGLYVVRVISPNLQYLEHSSISINKNRYTGDIDLLNLNKNPYPFS